MKQYVLFAAGYDTFSYRNTCGDISIFELDLPRMIEDRLAREAERELLGKYGFDICEHLNSGEMTERNFKEYNSRTAKQMSAPNGVGYIFAVKQVDLAS